MGNHSYAIPDFQKAIEIDNRYDTAYYLLGQSKLKSKQVESAISDFNQAQQLCRTTEALAAILDGLGQAFHKLGNYEDALVNFKDCLDLSPHNVEYLKNIAQCHFDIQEFKESAEYLEKALLENSQDP